MSERFNKLPHEIIELDIEEFSFNLFCMIHSDDEKDVPENYDQQVLDMHPAMKDPELKEKLASFNDKLPRKLMNG